MNIQIRLRRMAEGCALVAFPKWKNTGVRISNHSFEIDHQHVEWLSIFRPDGALRFLQHYPNFKHIGVLKPEEVSRLFPRQGKFTAGAIRGHFRNETRRRR
jgi:hypothetical protein